MTPKEKQKLVDNIIENFDWGKVKLVMETLNWKWQNDMVFEVPLIGEIMSSAQKLLYKILENNKQIQISTGGFVATFDGHDYLKLHFEIDSWDVSLEEMETTEPNWFDVN